MVRLHAAVVLVQFLFAGVAFSANLHSDLRDMFERNMDTLDFARVKIEVDRMIDPSIDVDAQLAQIDQMVATIRTMLPPNATSWDKTETIRRSIYQPGRGTVAKLSIPICVGPWGDAGRVPV